MCLSIQSGPSPSLVLSLLNVLLPPQLPVQAAVDKEALDLYKEDPKFARKYLTDYSIKNADEVVAKWGKMADMLKSKIQ